MNYKIYILVVVIIIGLVGIGINIYDTQKDAVIPQYQPNYPMNFNENKSLIINHTKLFSLDRKNISFNSSRFLVYTESDYVFKVTSPDKGFNRSTIIINKRYLINISNTSDNIIIEIDRNINLT